VRALLTRFADGRWVRALPLRKLLLSPNVKIAAQRRSALLYLYERRPEVDGFLAVSPLLSSTGTNAPVQAIGLSVLPSRALGTLLVLSAVPPTQKVKMYLAGDRIVSIACNSHPLPMAELALTRASLAHVNRVRQAVSGVVAGDAAALVRAGLGVTCLADRSPAKSAPAFRIGCALAPTRASEARRRAPRRPSWTWSRR